MLFYVHLILEYNFTRLRKGIVIFYLPGVSETVLEYNVTRLQKGIVIFSVAGVSETILEYNFTRLQRGVVIFYLAGVSETIFGELQSTFYVIVNQMKSCYMSGKVRGFV